MSTGQSAVTLRGWGLKAGMTHSASKLNVWLAVISR